MSTLSFLAQLYLGKVLEGVISIDDVPPGLRKQVEELLAAQEA